MTRFLRKLAAGLLFVVMLFSLAEFALVTVGFSRPSELPPPIRLWSQKDAKVVPEADGMFRFDPYLFWDLKPGAPVWGQGGERIGPDGFREPSVDLERRPASLRVACLGDSSTFGVYCAWEETYSARLWHLLRDEAPPESLPTIEVMNAGVGGYTTFQGLQCLQRKVLPYEPDVVVLMFGALNDVLPLGQGMVALSPERARRTMFTTPSPDETGSPDSHEGADRERSRSLLVAGIGRRVFSFVSRYRTVQALTSILPAAGAGAGRADLLRRRDEGESGIRPRVSLGDFREFLGSMIEVAEHDGARCVLLGPPRREELRRQHGALRRYNPAMADVALEYGVPFVDLEPVFDADPTLFVGQDPVHPSARGHEVIARKIVDALTASGWVRPGSR